MADRAQSALYFSRHISRGAFLNILFRIAEIAIRPAKASTLVTMVTQHWAEASGGQEGGP